MKGLIHENFHREKNASRNMQCFNISLLTQCASTWFLSWFRRLNMELRLQSFFGLHVHSCAHWLRPRNPPSPIWAHIRGGFWSAKIDDISLWPPGWFSQRRNNTQRRNDFLYVRLSEWFPRWISLREIIYALSEHTPKWFRELTKRKKNHFCVDLAYASEIKRNLSEAKNNFQSKQI